MTTTKAQRLSHESRGKTKTAVSSSRRASDIHLMAATLSRPAITQRAPQKSKFTNFRNQLGCLKAPLFEHKPCLLFGGHMKNVLSTKVEAFLQRCQF